MAGYLALVAEATNALSGVLIISCLLLVTFLILRFQHGDPSSVVRVQHQPVQVAVQKLFVPYTLQISTKSRETPADSDERLTVRVQCGACGRVCLVRWWWGVQRRALASLLHTPWQQFRDSVIDDLAFPGVSGQSKLVEEGDHVLELRSTEVLQLGPLPRERYPLVVVQLDTESQHCDSQVGSVVTVLHVRDADCPEPSRVLYQYLKQCTGQLTMLTTLYTQSNDVIASVPSSSHGSGKDTQKNSGTNLLRESTASTRNSEYSGASTSESTQNQTSTFKLQPSESISAGDSIEVETTNGKMRDKSKLDTKNRITKVNNDNGIIEDPNHVGVIGDCKQTKHLSDPDGLTEEPNEYCTNLDMVIDRTAECGVYSNDVVDACLKKRPSQVSDNGNISSNLSSHDFPLSCIRSSPKKEFDIGKPSETNLISSSELVTSPMSDFSGTSDESRLSSTTSSTNVDSILRSSCVRNNTQLPALNLDLTQAVEIAPDLTEIAVAAATEVSDTPAAVRSVTPSGTASELPSNVTFELPSCSAAELPSCSAAELPSCSAAELPSCPASELPSCSAAELPSCPASELPSNATSELPSCFAAELPSCDAVKLLSGAAVELPSDAASELPSDATSELPSCSAVELPSDAASELPSNTAVTSHGTAEVTSNGSTEVTSDGAAKLKSDGRADLSSGSTAERPSDSTSNLPSDGATEPSSDECVVCQVERVAVALLPCCHVCVCFTCFHHLMAQRQTCPLCRQHVSAYFVV